jgi:hypothetical protein
MDYFEDILKALEESISIETNKMIEASKKIEQLKKQKEVILALTNKVTEAY